MKLIDAVDQYVIHKQSMGMRFNSERRILKSFCCHQQGKDLAQITPGRVLEFIAGNGPPTRFWHRKHETLTGFYRFAIARGYVGGSPLPKSVPKLSHRFVPYIFSRTELKRLLDAVALCPRSALPCSGGQCLRSPARSRIGPHERRVLGGSVGCSGVGAVSLRSTSTGFVAVPSGNGTRTYPSGSPSRTGARASRSRSHCRRRVGGRPSAGAGSRRS